jgi:hypothetical protein
MQNDDSKTYKGNPDRDAMMQSIYHWSDQEVVAEAAGKDLHEFARFKGGYQQAADEFPEIFNNTDLAARAAQMDEELVQSGDRRPYLERYRDICNAIHSGEEVSAQGGSTISDEEFADVQALQMGSEVEAAQVLRKYRQQNHAYQQAEAEESTSDTIAAMRNARLPDAFKG